MSQGQTDGCYLVTGHRTDFTADCAAVAYYANFKLGGGNDGEQPDDFVFVAIGQPSTHIDNYNFTGQQSVTFPKSGVTFSWNIQGDGASQGIGTNVGTASNGAEQFTVYRDAGSVPQGGLVTTNDGFTLFKQFYCN